MYTGVQIYQDLKRQLKQYESDVVVPSMGNYILKKALYEVIEENYKNLAVQKNKDELGSLVKTERTFLVYDNGINVGVIPVSSVVVSSATTYTITFGWAHHLGQGISIAISGVLGTTAANGSYSYVTSAPTAGQYSITNSSTIVVGVVSATGTYTADTGTMTNVNIPTDYLHLLMARLTFEQPTKYSVKTSSFSSPITVEINENNNLRTNEVIKISGVGGNTNTNGTFYIKKRKLKTFQLYSDADLDTPVAGNASYTSGGALKRVVESYTKPMNSDEKIDYFSPTVRNPKIETTEKQLIAYPKNSGCVSIVMDYITTETKELITTSTIDYEMYYNRTFLDKVINRAAQNFSIMVQSPNEYQMITSQINQNTNAIS
jgi:hypothetical protein